MALQRKMAFLTLSILKNKFIILRYKIVYHDYQKRIYKSDFHRVFWSPGPWSNILCDQRDIEVVPGYDRIPVKHAA